MGLGRVGMKKLKNSHKERVVRNFCTRGMCCVNFAQGDVLCEFRTRGCVVRKFRTRHYSPAQMRNWILSNGHNFIVSNPNRTPFEALDS